MHDIQSVQILERPRSLGEEETGLGLGKDLLSVLVEEEISVLRILENHVDAALLADGVPQRCAVRVAERGVDANLPLNQSQLSL